MLLTDLKAALPIFREPHFSPYKVYIQRAHKQVVMLNPKVGSSAFRRAVVAAMQEQGLPPMRSRLWPINTNRRYMTAPLRDYAQVFAHPQDYRFHCFVRNPYARVISAWNDKLVKGFHQPRYPRSMRKLVPRIRRFAQQQGLPGATEAAPVPFPTFLSFVESEAEGQRDQHWDTQVSVLCTDRLQYEHVHRIETDLVAGVSQILEPLGVSGEWVAERFARPVNASGAIKEPVLDEALAERVFRVYEKDFIRFGYDRDSWRDL